MTFATFCIRWHNSSALFICFGCPSARVWRRCAPTHRFFIQFFLLPCFALVAEEFWFYSQRVAYKCQGRHLHLAFISPACLFSPSIARETGVSQQLAYYEVTSERKARTYESTLRWVAIKKMYANKKNACLEFAIPPFYLFISNSLCPVLWH